MNTERTIMESVVMTAPKWAPDHTSEESRLKPINIGDVLKDSSTAPIFTWGGLLPLGEVSLLSGHGGTGKSTIALMLAVATVAGRELMGLDVRQSSSLFLSLEDSPDVVRYRVAQICKTWAIDPQDIASRLHIFDGTGYPELFTAHSRGTGGTTPTFEELRNLVQRLDARLILVDNASDAFGGDEIQRRQVKAFMRSLAALARENGAAVLLLAHVDKTTSRARNGDSGEDYSGSTAWHNSVRSRLSLSRTRDDTIVLKHKKCNSGKLQDPIELYWPENGLPESLHQSNSCCLSAHIGSKINNEKAIALLRLMDESERKGRYFGASLTAKNNVFATLRNLPAFQALKLNSSACRGIVEMCLNSGWIERTAYRTQDRKDRERLALTLDGYAFAGISAPSAPSAPSTCPVIQ